MFNNIFLFSLLILFLVSCSQLEKSRDYIYSKIPWMKKEEAKSVETSANEEKVEVVQGEAKVPTVVPVIPTPPIVPLHTQEVSTYCAKIDKSFERWGWPESECLKYEWNHVRNSVKGDPLIWYALGNEEEHKNEHKDTTMVLCGIHGDEITPVKFCFDIIEHAKKYAEEFKDKMIVIAPIVNPDSFFKSKPTRTNQRMVDINRNFPTKDWDKDAIRMWKSRYGSDKRRYPGQRPLSEPEVVFQVNLIKRYNPDKIISVHAPLTLLDYDGPTKDINFKAREEVAKSLLIQMSQKASGYKIKNYPYFPGSLGNWAGNERSIPTYTLELPSSDPSKSAEYWELFREAIHSAFHHDFQAPRQVAFKKKPAAEPDAPVAKEQ